MPTNGELGNEYALSDEELTQVRSYRERYDVETSDVRAIGSQPDGLSAEALSAISDQEIRDMISTQARDLVITQEIGSRAAYDRRYKHPEWPGAQSGVTIGLGYDIGQSGLEDFTHSWKDKLPAEAFERLAQTVGVVGPAARGLPRTLQDIEVPWEAAEEVFTNSTAPKYARLVLLHLANARELHPHSFGALFSLVYNRGASFGNPGDRYREMRNIRAHMHERKFDQVPGEFRAMKRLWEGQGVPGLLKRRDLEAALFAQGLTAPPVVAAPAPVPAPTPVAVPQPQAEPAPALVAAPADLTTASVPIAQPAPSPAPAPAVARSLRRTLRIAPEADEDWVTLERAVERGLEAPPATRGKPSYTANDVSWSPDDTNPEYRHLDKALADREFSFTAKDLELIISASSFQPTRENGVILFGLRGAELVGGPSQVNSDVLRLKDARPDHRAFRCVIGAYHVGRQQLSGFIGSTVPNNGSVYTNWARHASGGPPYGNMLLSGCYRYKVGTHVGGVEVPGAFRLQEDDEVVVLRSNLDVAYDTLDHWDPCVPHDNLHPSFRNMSFSSAGCQTVRGTFNDGEHIGEWAQFRKAVGLGSSDNGKRFDYVLVTGLEAAIAAKARTQNIADPAAIQSRLARIRYGSQGEIVKRLQKALNRPETGFFNADDKVTLAALQREKLGSADGVYSPDMDAKLGFNVFTAPVEVAVVDTRSLAPTTRVALVIGNGAYQNPGARLINPPNDAHVVSAELEKLGFRVNLVVDKTREEMSEAISLFVDRMQSSEVNADTGLVFYAGHGVQIDGENYILPTDVSARNVVSLIDSSLPLNNIIRQLERTKKAGLIFLDCCRNNPFPGATRSLGGGLAKIDAPAGTFIAFSTAPGAVALDGEDTPNSPFTSSLITHLAESGISISQMMIRVRRDVFEKSKGQQMPWDSSSLLVDFAFNPGTATRSVHQVPLSPEEVERKRREEAARTEAEAWELTSQSNNEQLLRSFMTTYPYSKHRGEAAGRLARLRLKNRLFWVTSAVAALALVACVAATVQWFRLWSTQLEDRDLIGGDVNLVLADLGINRFEDISLLRCQLRCIYSLFSCKAYSFDRRTGRCYIKEDYLFLDATPAAKDNVSAYLALWGRKPPEPSPFKMFWNQTFESGDAILPNGDPAPVAVANPKAPEEVKLDAEYNSWGLEVEDLVEGRPGNPGIVCQRLCLEQEKCVGFTFNALFGRCKLYRWIRQDDQGTARVLSVPHYSQPDESSRMTLFVPLIFSGVHPGRNK
jgi:uncharacterized caspase-like protein